MYVNIDDVHMLIDVGLSMKQINKRLLMYHGIDLEDINVILITHRHIDHVQSLHTIIKKYATQVIMPHKVKEEYTVEFERELDGDIIEVDKLNANKVFIKAFELKHDVSCFGYVIKDKETEEEFVFIADNGGWLPKELLSELSDKEYYAIDSNHDLTMQIMDPNRNELLKRRVLGGWGHTHNFDAFRIANAVATEKTKGIIFHHISGDCNTIELAQETHQQLISIWGEKTKFKNIRLRYAEQDKVVDL